MSPFGRRVEFFDPDVLTLVYSVLQFSLWEAWAKASGVELEELDPTLMALADAN